MRHVYYLPADLTQRPAVRGCPPLPQLETLALAQPHAERIEGVPGACKRRGRKCADKRQVQSDGSTLFRCGSGWFELSWVDACAPALHADYQQGA